MLLLAALGAVLLSSVSGTRSLNQIANAPAADLISAGLNAIQSDPNGTATALANSTPYTLITLCIQSLLLAAVPLLAGMVIAW